MGMIFVLDNIRSAFNVGSIFRLADGVGADLAICGISPTPSSCENKISKTALGAENTVRWEYYESAVEAIKLLRKANPDIVIYALENQKTAKSLFDIDFQDDIGLIFGHEITGVSTEVIGVSDHVVKIPMEGSKNSLNVAMAAGIVAYQAYHEQKN